MYKIFLIEDRKVENYLILLSQQEAADIAGINKKTYKISRSDPQNRDNIYFNNLRNPL